jgi:hypothetical protein
MKRPLVCAVIAVTVVMGAACAATLSVSSHVDHGVDFAVFRTYDWGPADALPTGDPRLDANPFFKDHVQGAVEKQLATRGLRLVTTETPDLLIHYHASISTRMDVNRADEAYGYCSVGDCPSNITQYEAGTLVIDIMDARTNKLLWRGWAQNSVEDALRDPDKMARMIDRAVTEMSRHLPRSL